MTPTALRRALLALIPICIALVSALAAQTGPRNPAAQGAAAIPYTTGTWDADTLGNHRVVLEVDAPADAVRARIPWRRRDTNPEQKNLLVFDAQSGARIVNVVRVTDHAGRRRPRLPADVREGPLLRLLPPERRVRPFELPEGRLPGTRADTARPEWLAKHRLAADASAAPGQKAPALPLARVVEFQAIDELNCFYPMEVIATARETQALLARHLDRLLPACSPRTAGSPSG